MRRWAYGARGRQGFTAVTRPASTDLSMPQSDSEPVDPKPAIEAACAPACSTAWTAYEKCKERIAAKGSGNCEAWAFDYWKCIDKCVSRRETIEQHAWTRARVGPVIAATCRRCLPPDPRTSGCAQDLLAPQVGGAWRDGSWRWICSSA
jgi:ubiquinol-cytochrome c reductase subunit 6